MRAAVRELRTGREVRCFRDGGRRQRSRAARRRRDVRLPNRAVRRRQDVRPLNRFRNLAVTTHSHRSQSESRHRALRSARTAAAALWLSEGSPPRFAALPAARGLPFQRRPPANARFQTAEGPNPYGEGRGRKRCARTPVSENPGAVEPNLGEMPREGGSERTFSESRGAESVGRGRGRKRCKRLLPKKNRVQPPSQLGAAEGVEKEASQVFQKPEAAGPTPSGPNRSRKMSVPTTVFDKPRVEPSLLGGCRGEKSCVLTKLMDLYRCPQQQQNNESASRR